MLDTMTSKTSIESIDMKELYQSPLSSRYASTEMSMLFSDQHKFHTWRKIWFALAKAEHELRLPVSQEQLDELEKNIDLIDFKKADAYEKKFKHDVMAHVHTYADQCPKAAPIIHLGATSCTITDNADLIIMRDALQIVQRKLMQVIQSLSNRADENKNIICLSFTHLQPAQPTTVGKRFALWLQDFLFDAQELMHCINQLQLLGLKGTTGTQASFMTLFDGDHVSVKRLEDRFVALLGFNRSFSISGQTYSRKQDIYIVNVLANIAQSSHKFATDLRLLSFMQEVEEPWQESQIGSSAMPHKRNPMKSERVCALARYVMSLSENPKYTASVQWLERTLDDSANRRLVIPEAFLTVDAILNLIIAIIPGLVINPVIIKQNVEKELPFLLCEYILMESVKKGSDRQTVHERLRNHCKHAAMLLKQGQPVDLFKKFADDVEIPFTLEELKQVQEKIPTLIGRAPEQVTEFLENQVNPFLKKIGTSNQIYASILY